MIFSEINQLFWYPSTSIHSSKLSLLLHFPNSQHSHRQFQTRLHIHVRSCSWVFSIAETDIGYSKPRNRKTRSHNAEVKPVLSIPHSVCLSLSLLPPPSDIMPSQTRKPHLAVILRSFLLLMFTPFFSRSLSTAGIPLLGSSYISISQKGREQWFFFFLSITNIQPDPHYTLFCKRNSEKHKLTNHSLLDLCVSCTCY